MQLASRARGQKLRANRFLHSFQLTFYRTVVNRAADADHGATEKGGILRIARADFLASQLLDTSLDFALFRVGQVAGGDNFGLGESESRIKLFFQLLDDRIKEMYAPVIDQYRNQISHLLGNAVALGDCIEQTALLLGGNRGIFPYSPQIRTLCQ